MLWFSPFGKIHLSVLIIGLSLRTWARSCKGVTQRCPGEPAIPLADTDCSDITPHRLKLYPKRGSFESETLVALQVRIIWPFPPSCEPHQLRKVVEVPLDEKERRIWGHRVLSQEATRIRFWQGWPWWDRGSEQRTAWTPLHAQADSTRGKSRTQTGPQHSPQASSIAIWHCCPDFVQSEEIIPSSGAGSFCPRTKHPKG